MTRLDLGWKMSLVLFASDFHRSFYSFSKSESFHSTIYSFTNSETRIHQPLAAKKKPPETARDMNKFGYISPGLASSTFTASCR